MMTDAYPQRYPIRYTNPRTSPTEVWLALDSTRKCILLRCVTSVGALEIFPTIAFGTPGDFDCLEVLVRHRMREVQAGRVPESFTHVSSRSLMDELEIEEPALKRRFVRLRRRLLATAKLRWTNSVIFSDMLVDSKKGQAGYRLARTIRVVDRSEMHSPRPPSNGG
jgi:hypothetical protein